MIASAVLAGTWLIVASGTWSGDHLGLYGPAFLRIDAHDTGEMAFGTLCVSIDGRFTPNGVDFDWNGTDEGDMVTIPGSADLRDDVWLEGETAYDNG
ncbi:hypothetical protein [Sphingomonas sp. PAMC 26621]|uniref:hypothetical protein n=1 Tax=Sphingomonas sp. PAMC 26621 TaxID=1112213 RepID=UPI000288B92B|nr:hypothetical protein [Sphingomonas sp. PAMC 26621]